MQADMIRWPMTFLAGVGLIASAACTQGEAAQVAEGIDSGIGATLPSTYICQ